MGEIVAEDPLFESYQLGPLLLRNRIVMAPMTRNRSTFDRIPTDLMRDYYGQRASAGLIISEGIIPDAPGRAYMCVPGLYNEAQVEAWRPITSAVHEKGGLIFAQLMHGGRISHASFLDGDVPIAPSAVAARGEVFTAEGLLPFPEPQAMTEDQIIATVEGYGAAASNAIRAGFDGIEIHAASGYLPSQFLSTNANRRTDDWGGSIEGRARFVLAVTDRVSEAVGAERVGVRVSPGFGFNDIEELDPVGIYSYLAEQLGSRGIAYIHVIDAGSEFEPLDIISRAFKGTIIANRAYDKMRAVKELEGDRAQLISFGEAFVSNPDLPERLAGDLPLAIADRATFYTPGSKGYTDYPPYSVESANSSEKGGIPLQFTVERGRQ